MVSLGDVGRYLALYTGMDMVFAATGATREPGVFYDNFVGGLDNPGVLVTSAVAAFILYKDIEAFRDERRRRLVEAEE